jgi:hypothetical protein
MNNKTKINGDKNFVVQGTRNSKINVQNENNISPNKQTYVIIGIIVAVLGVIASIIIGWDNILNFFDV